MALRAYLYTKATGLPVFASPADISWSADTLVQPDVFVVPLSEARTLDWNQIKDVRLAIEVLSPSSTRADRSTKRRLYQERSIPTYWHVDGEERPVGVGAPQTEAPA